MIVAIDGPAGTGKSTIARMIAERTGFTYVNSGSLYRALTYGLLSAGLDPSKEGPVVEWAQTARLEYRNGRVFLNGQDVDEFLRTDAVEAWVAQVSAFIPLRRIVNEIVRGISRTMDIVVEGRDMTTAVFPNAEYKFYLDATPDSRAQRRLAQGTSGLSLLEIRQNIEMRDRIDREKPEGPLKVAPDAVYLDTSHLTIEEVYEKVYTKIQQ